MALAQSHARLYAPGVPLGQRVPLLSELRPAHEEPISSIKADNVAASDHSLLAVFSRGAYAGVLKVGKGDEHEIVARLVGETCARTPDREAIQVLMDELQDAAQKQDVEAVIVARRRLLAAFDALLADAPKEVPE